MMATHDPSESMIQAAFREADATDEGYTVRLALRGGREVHGAKVDYGRDWVRLDLWGDKGATGAEVFVGLGAIATLQIER